MWVMERKPGLFKEVCVHIAGMSAIKCFCLCFQKLKDPQLDIFRLCCMGENILNSMYECSLHVHLDRNVFVCLGAVKPKKIKAPWQQQVSLSQQLGDPPLITRSLHFLSVWGILAHSSLQHYLTSSGCFHLLTQSCLKDQRHHFSCSDAWTFVSPLSCCTVSFPKHFRQSIIFFSLFLPSSCSVFVLNSL